MEKFEEIARTLNAGLHNQSTLLVVIPLLTQYCLEKRPDAIDELANWFIPEQALNKPHPGLDERYVICNEAITHSKNIEQAIMKK